MNKRYPSTYAHSPKLVPHHNPISLLHDGFMLRQRALAKAQHMAMNDMYARQLQAEHLRRVQPSGGRH